MGLLPDWIGRKPLQLGAAAPQITAIDEEGNPIDLGTIFAQGTTLLFFYPKASTVGCTAQACSLRDGFAELKERGVRIFGVSFDTSHAQKEFREKKRLPFTLLADTDKALARAFGVPSFFGFVARQSFLIRDGLIVAHFPHAKTSGHAEEVLEHVR